LSTRSRDLSAFYELIYNPSYAPSRSNDAHIERLEVDGKPTFVLAKESTGEYYEVDEATNTVWGLLDGSRTVGTISSEAEKAGVSLSEKEVQDIVISLAEEGTIESTEPEVEQKRIQVVSALHVDVNLLKDCSKSLARFFRVTRRLARKGELPIAVGIVFVGVVLFAGTFVHIFSNTSIFDIEGSALIGLLFYQLLVLSPVYAIHELSHAAACDYYGGKPRSLGTGLYYLAPFFFVDTTDSWRLPRRARIMIHLAGPLVEMVVASGFVFWSYFLGPGFGKNLLLISAFLCFYGSLLNLSPIMETDGYYLVSEVVKMPNLRDETYAFLRRFTLGKLGRPSAVRRVSARNKRIFLAFATVTVAWIVVFAYTTLNFMYVYGADALRALTFLLQTANRVRPLDPMLVGVNIAALAYFGLFLAGFGVMGVVSYRKVRMKGVKLETIHDKRVSVLLPVPSFIGRQKASEFVERAKKTSGKFSRSYSVTLEPPLCVAALKLGRTDESLDQTRAEMQRLEQAFRSIHGDFLVKNLSSAVGAARRPAIAESLEMLAGQFPVDEKKGAETSASEFLREQDRRLQYLLQSAFGTLWTLELSPEDYRRINRGLLPSLIAEDLGVTGFAGELEAFKKHTVLGADTLVMLSAEIEQESKEVSRRPELYQLTAFLEPVKSRLVFAGRTAMVEGSIVWLGGLFLYQAWTGYIGEVLEDATLGLRSIRLVPSISMTKTQTAKLSDHELGLIKEDHDRMAQLVKASEESIVKLTSTLDSASNFHESLGSIVENEAFDIGLYRPILTANGKHLTGIRERIKDFQTELSRIRKVLDTSAAEVKAEYFRRASGAQVHEETPFRSLTVFLSGGRFGTSSRTRSPVFDNQVKLMFATTKLLYGAVIGSDIVL
jgi:putative peptide zinc metalloprotease protein